MINVALIFPGQGAQKVGMGKELYDAIPAAKAIFDSAQATLGNDLLDVIFNGPQEKLTLTSYSQPAIVSCSIAGLKALQAHPKFGELKIAFTAGLSLGEYSALIASGALSFEDGIRLVQKRGAFMDEACKLQQGAMAAIIGFPKDRLKEICRETGAQVANFNSPEQIVITGHADKVQAAVSAIEKENPKNIVMLEVAGGFHSSLMKSAAEKFSAELSKFNLQTLSIPLVGNVKGVAETDPEIIRQNLPLQITSSVLWEDSVRFMAAQGVKYFIEIGPGKILKGLIRRIDPTLTVFNIEKPQDIETVFSI
ncbi:MAG TPA: ACP S-malonyltransferase [Candidatus Omnitrophota bacterium]|nr:ACP S-malonyltransferase [Candidatus Omnitrophota bacterium]HQL41029.1 ACP S-malonyltransferase [Candidatus Omnitrophota bacterium]